ncbi:ABC transporter ATP-binding protein [Bacteroides acidifaciens]|uniref:ABC transporter ATP-binding protein n=1 Tax=Bacteroides acidifaciens TaxID=85831 RepID=UPI00259B18B8|nr:polysaccharide ABC transporter ATP-binding protein [Bacteroides acidifaciens]
MNEAEKREVVIQVRNMSKKFRIYFDKGHMLKEKLLFTSRNRYETRTILDNISFDIYKGEAVGLIGHNGCGKSTALKLLTRIIYPDSGTVNVKGRVSSLLELGAGFHPDLSGRENIYINASIFGLKRKEIDEKIHEIISFSELGEFIDNPVRTYSSGMYMRLAFSVAINVKADILLVDEILAVGDAGFQMKCLNKIGEIKDEGTTIVLVSHSMDQIKKVCDRCIWINNSQVAAIGETEEVAARYMAYVDEIEKNKWANELIGRPEEVKVETDKKNNLELLEVKLLDCNLVDKRIWGIGESMRICIRFKLGANVFAKIRFEIARADGIVAYANIFDKNGENFLLNEENELSFVFNSLNLLAGKFYMMMYIEDGNGELLGSVTPFAEIDIVDDSYRYGISNMECVCELSS